MKAFGVTDIGVEWCAALEIEEMVGAECDVHEAVVSFDASDKELALLCTRSQSCRRFLRAIVEMDASSLESMQKELGKALEKSYLDGKSFRVTCDRVGEHSFTSHDAEKALGATVVEKYGNDVDLEDPEVIIFCQIQEDMAYVGFDFSGKDLSQRDYRVYSHPSSFRGDIAYSLVRMAGFEKGMVLLDPFAGSSVIPIEAAYFSTGVDVHQEPGFAFEKFMDYSHEPVLEADEEPRIFAFDHSLNALKYGKNNARIGRVDNLITFSKCDVEWLDTKFDKHGVDVIVTQPPQNSNHASAQLVRSVYDEFFYQSKYVLAEQGCIVVLMNNTGLFLGAAEKHNFEVTEQRKIIVGEIEYSALKLRKKLK